MAESFVWFFLSIGMFAIGYLVGNAIAKEKSDKIIKHLEKQLKELKQ